MPRFFIDQHNTSIWTSPARSLPLLLVLSLPISVVSQGQGSSPDKLIEDLTLQLFQVVEEARSDVAEDPAPYYDEVEKIVSQYIDFNFFSRRVMGVWGSKDRFDSLKSDAERTLFITQTRHFSAVFRRTLVETYSKGLLNLRGRALEVRALGDAAIDDAVYVQQAVQTASGERHLIGYLMKRNRHGDWRICNVLFDELNLGKVYRNQFAAAVIKHNGDIDRVIDDWGKGRGDNQ